MGPSEQSFLDFFPHETIRDGQVDLVRDIHQALKEQKIILAHAPTGLGKTASALSAAVQYALEQDKIVFFLTNRHTQHRIAVDTLKQMKRKTGKEIIVADLLGKRWMCNHRTSQMGSVDINEFCKAIVAKGECEFYNAVFDKQKTTPLAKHAVSQLLHLEPLHSDELMARAQEEKLCSYEIALLLAKKSRIIIADYNYLFSSIIQEIILKKLEKSLEDFIVIIDEGHNLPARVIDMLSSSLTTVTLRNAIQEAKKFKLLGMIEWLQHLNSILLQLNMLQDVEERFIEKEDLVRRIQAKVPYELLVKELDSGADEVLKQQQRSFLGSISSFLHQWEGPDDSYARILSEHQGKIESIIRLSYHCLDPAVATKDIFSAIHAGVVMSGTLQPTSMFKDLLGIERSMEKCYPSPFPAHNKVTLIIPETTTKYSLRNQEMYQLIGQHCSTLAALIPGNVAFFFPSYALRDTICNFLKTSKKLFWEKQALSAEEKEMLLKEFAAGRASGGILLGVAGANFAEGVDFPGDILQGVVVVGLPLQKPDLKTQATIRYYDSKFGKGWDYGYIIPAMTKCIQSAGRCIRSETDRGAVIFLDERFAWPQYYQCFPDRIGLMVTRKYKEKITEFFKNKDVEASTPALSFL